MTAPLLRLGAWLACFAASCAKIDALSNSPPSNSSPVPARSGLPIEGELPSFDSASSWLNSPALTEASLHGKVVLVQFWTYSCINWRRTLPYVRAWSKRYASAGLVTVGVHTPEFEFEQELANVRRAVRDADIGFPIAVDSQRAIWNAFGNEYWPALYFVDAQGRIRHRLFGEGEYERSEAILRELLTDAGALGLPPPLADVPASGPELAADWANLRSPETYLGDLDREGASLSLGPKPGRRHWDAEAEPLGLNQWALMGDWTTRGQAAVLERAGGRIVYRFHSRDVHLVMGPAKPGSVTRFRVQLDGLAPGKARGVDIDEGGVGTLSEPRMYQLIRQPRPISDRDFQIEFFDAPVAAYSFTFG